MAYSKKIIDHYENPRNVGVLAEGDDIGTGMVGAPACGDVMQLQIRVNDEGRITDARFKAFGCGSAIASASRATELLQNLSLQEAGALKNTVIAQDLALPPVKMHCSMLAEDAIKAAIQDFLGKSRQKNAQVELGSKTLHNNS
jgi:nitrogen fixation NifU-like protein